MKTLTERVAALSPQQRELLLRARDKQRRTTQEPTIPARTGSGPWPACADQAALWYFQQVDAEAVPYNIGNAQRLFGPLVPAALDQAYADLVQRQEMLRAYYPVVDGVPHVAVATDPELAIVWVDLRNVPAEEREERARQTAATLINQPFDLTNGPIVRFVVIRLTNSEHLMIPVMHHSITDAVSYNIFFRELIALYSGRLKQRPVELPPITRHYIDYGLWRNDWLASAAFEAQLAWWRQELADAPTLVKLPGDYPRPKVFNDRGSRTFFKVNPRVTQALRARNRNAGSTSLMTLLAATYALFYRYADLQDMLIAVPASHREHEEMTHVIGYFLNYVPFRGRVQRGMCFRDLLEDTKTTVLGGLKHKRVPFSAIVDAVKPARDLSAMPLAQLGFVYVSAAGLNTEAAKLHRQDGPEFRIEGYYADREISPMDLQFIFMEGADEVDCFIEYAADIYKPETMDHLAATFLTLFEGLLANPEQAIDTLPLTKQPQTAPIQTQPTPVPAEPATLHEPFFAQAQRTPAVTAVVAGEHSLSYAALAQRAETLARGLTAMGVGPQSTVAVNLPAGVDAVALVFAIWRLGAVYCPVDMPPQRRATVLATCRPIVTVVDETLKDQAWSTTRLVGIAELLETGELHVDQPLPQRADPDGIAAVLHTSGSTGVPKGVMVTHQSLGHRLDWLAGQCPAESGESFALTAGANVNESLMEICDALHRGGTLYIAPAEIRREPAKLATFLGKHRIARVQMVPSVLRLISATTDIGDTLAALRLLVVHGESLPVDVAAATRRRLPWVRLWNNYGLTEATGCSAFAVGECADLPGTVPVGHSLGGLDLYLLDAAMNPVPPGTVGKLYLGGSAISPGYRDNPTATAERFVPNPFGNGDRLMRSGDLARFDEIRGLTIMGRADRQLKIRGNRIEPGEIEAALRGHEAVADAAVFEVDGHLAAAVQADRPLEGEDLRRFLMLRLPEAMVPTRFRFLDALPHTASSKTDLRRLQQTTRATPNSVSQSAQPRTELEQSLARIWGSVLNHPAPGIDDDFYEMGGHSLRAAEIAAQLHRELGREVPLALLLQTRSIRRMAEAIERLDEWRQTRQGSGPIQIGPKGDIQLFALPPMLGFAMVYRPLAERLPDVTLLGFDFTQTDDPVRHFADQIDAAQPEGPLHLMGYSAGGNLAFAITQVLEQRGRSVQQLILFDSMYREAGPTDAAVCREKRIAFLADLQHQLREDPVMGAYADEGFVLGLIEKTPGAFHTYHSQGCDRGTVAAPIAFIRGGADEPEREPLRQAWQRSSATAIRFHQGHGRHEAMLSGDALDRNAALLGDILRRPTGTP